MPKRRPLHLQIERFHRKGSGAFAFNPATITKRLGDGFYEQRLIREQINQLTGRRFLTGYSSDEEAYRALMTNGATFAQAYQLTAGVALTEAQIAQLTSDIVLNQWGQARLKNHKPAHNQWSLTPLIYGLMQLLS